MKVVIQRVSKASVSVDNNRKSKINKGLLILLGVEVKDNSEDVLWLVNKIASLRIFSDEKGVMNKSIIDIKGDVVVVSQFTLHAKTKKGNRPTYIKAAKPKDAEFLYNNFISNMSDFLSKPVFSGEFGSNMQVELVNDGPVTIFIDTKQKE